MTVTAIAPTPSTEGRQPPQRLGDQRRKSRSLALFNGNILLGAVGDSFRKLNPRAPAAESGHVRGVHWCGHHDGGVRSCGGDSRIP